ncbi:reverse transcriptase domain-containing protein [Tanacetum coccineum]
MERFKVETGRMKGAPECMRISGFMHGVNNPELTKRLNEHVPKTMEEMMITTTTFIRGEVVAAGKKKGRTSWRAHDQSKRYASEWRYDFRGQPREGRGSSKFTPLQEHPKKSSRPKQESLNRTSMENPGREEQALQCSGTSTMIRDTIRMSGRDQPKVGKKEVPAKDKSMAIYMIQPWHRMTRQKVTQSFERVSKITFPSLTTSSGTEGPLVIEAEIWRHMIHRMYVDGGSSTEPEGIKPCPDKTEVVLQLLSPRIIKEVQSLNGKLASLNRFLSKSAEKSLPLFKTLKKFIKKSDFHWTPNAEQAFKQLKQHLLELPLLVAPKPKEEQIVYLFASYGAISAVLMTERGMVQTPVYFVSRALQGPELNYTPMEKLILSLVFAAKRLQRYFQAHPIAIITDQPIKQIISRPDVAGRLQKWSTLENFLVENPAESLPDTSVVETPQEPWTLFTDGSSCVDGSGAGLILTSPEGTKFTYALRLQVTASNNEVEYEALIVGLRITAQIGVHNVHVSVDSKLVANQVLGAYVTKEKNMIKYLEKVKSLVSDFANFFISQVPRSKNKKADALSRIASTSFAHLSKQVLVKILKEKSIQENEVTTMVEEDGLTWMIQILEYLKEGTLPEDKKEASKLRIKAKQYEFWEGVLYRRMHVGPRSVVANAMRLGYYWPTMHRDARNVIRAWTKKGQNFDSRYGLFHKVDKGESLVDITGNQVKKFVWDNIVCRFGLPGEIILDNGKYLGDGIKARLGEGNKNWIEELPHVLWAHRTTIKSSHSDTPFSLTYGTEAAIPTEIRMPTYRTMAVDAVHNDEELRLNLNLLEERRERATIHEVKAKLQMTKYYNARVRGVTFRPGDFVYRSNDVSHTVRGNFGPKWEDLMRTRQHSKNKHTE